jgi:hypothetical protein
MGRPEGKNHLENLGVGRMILLKLTSGSEIGQPGMAKEKSRWLVL